MNHRGSSHRSFIPPSTAPKFFDRFRFVASSSSADSAHFKTGQCLLTHNSHTPPDHQAPEVVTHTDHSGPTYDKQQGQHHITAKELSIIAQPPASAEASSSVNSHVLSTTQCFMSTTRAQSSRSTKVSCFGPHSDRCKSIYAMTTLAPRERHDRVRGADRLRVARSRHTTPPGHDPPRLRRCTRDTRASTSRRAHEEDVGGRSRARWS